MPIALADHIRRCLERAAEADRLAACEVEPVTKAELMELASSWRKVAADYQYVEGLESFLKTYKAAARCRNTSGAEQRKASNKL